MTQGLMLDNQLSHTFTVQIANIKKKDDSHPLCDTKMNQPFSVLIFLVY